MTSIHYINLKQIGGEIYCVNNSDSEDIKMSGPDGQTLKVKIGTGTDFMTDMISKEDAEKDKEKDKKKAVEEIKKKPTN